MKTMKAKATTMEEQEVFDYTKYEKARMIGSRALQLSMGAPFLLNLSPADLEKIKFNPIEIAIMEFNEGILPITIKRPVMSA